MSVLSEALVKDCKTKNSFKNLNPEDLERLRGYLPSLLKVRFGGLDFWRLSKEWKEVQYAQVSNEIISLMDVLVEKKLEPYKLEIKKLLDRLEYGL